MPYDNIHDFIEGMKRKEELIEVHNSVDRDLELTWLLSEEERTGKGRTMLFTDVKGSDLPVVGNIFSTQEKMNDILGNNPESIGNDMVNLIKPPKESGSMIMKGIEMLRELSGLRPKIHERLPSTHSVLDKVDLLRYPICKTWPDDAAPFVTLPVVIWHIPLIAKIEITFC